MSVSILDQLRCILEHSNNGYTFRYRCKGLQMIIEKQPDNSIIAYYADDSVITVFAFTRSVSTFLRQDFIPLAKIIFRRRQNLGEHLMIRTFASPMGQLAFEL